MTTEPDRRPRSQPPSAGSRDDVPLAEEVVEQSGSDGQATEPVVAAIREHAEERKRRELATALDALDASGGLTDGQRDAVEALADRLVDRLLAPPTASLRAAAAAGDPADLRVALWLFDPDTALGTEVADD